MATTTQNRPSKRLLSASLATACLLSLLPLASLMKHDSRLSLEQAKKVGATHISGRTSTKRSNGRRRSPSRSPPPQRDDARHRTFYSVLRSDRMGAVVQDMLVAHAYAFRRGLTYAGACPPSSPTAHINVTAADVSAVLRDLRLDGMLRVACPEGDGAGIPVVDRTLYARQGLAAWCTPEWQRFVRDARLRRLGNRSNSSVVEAPNRRPPRAVAHVRRGDVHPCSNSTVSRYLPNSYYLRAIRRYVPAGHPLTIYSEPDSFEPWQEFSLPPTWGWELRFDTNVSAIWRDMAEADVLIMSKSSFSVVPALLHVGGGGGVPGGARTVVVYPDFWIDPLPHWTRVDRAWMLDAEEDAQRLRRDACP